MVKERFVYAYALGSGGDLLLDLDGASLTMADVDDLHALFGVVEKTLRRVVVASVVACPRSREGGQGAGRRP